MENRKLAAILAADIVGYSRLAGADEERTLIRLRSLRSEFLDPTIQANNGRVVKRLGDGLIVEFRSVVDATRCAVEIQRGMSDRNASTPREQKLQFRIGIHVGDIVEEADGDLLGDGVNIAARLEGLAKPGAICLSEDAYRQVRNRLSLSIDDLGLNRLKNIAEPIRVYSVGVETAPARSKAAASKPASRMSPVAAGLVVAVLAAVVVAGGVYLFVRGAPPPAPRASNTPAAATAPATLKEANAELDAGHYEKAFRLFSALAGSGDAEAQRQLGRLYRDGRGTPRNAPLAVQWLTKSAEQNNASAQSALGEIYWRGAGVEPDYAQALRWFEKSAAQGNAIGQNGLGVLYENGFGAPQNYTTAMEWFRKAADQGYGWGMANLAYAYANGQGAAKNCEQAKAWLTKAVAGGAQDIKTYVDAHPVCQPEVAATPSPTVAAATLESANAEYERGHYENAFRLYSELADGSGDPSAEANVGEFYRRGLGVKRDYTLARRWFQKAADQDNPLGQNGLGVLYQNGLGVEQDYAQALQWFRKSADQRYGWGLANLGTMYKNGWGVAVDYDAALQSFKAAAEQNNPAAQNGLGDLYENGWGVEQDSAQAFDWYSRAAKQNFAWGMANLGYLYARGAGVAEDCDQAKAWFSKALASGGQDVRDYLISHQACEFDASAQ